MAKSSLHISLWGEALKLTIYLLNRVPIKETIKTPYELWTGRKPTLKYLDIWGCPAQGQSYVPKERKLDLRTINCYFVGYLENLGVANFTILVLEVSLKLKMHISFRILNLMGGNKVSNTNFEEEHDDNVNAKGNLILSCVQENVSCPSTSYSQIAYPQEEVSFKESTVQKGSQILNNLSIYLQEHEADLKIKENDFINLG